MRSVQRSCVVILGIALGAYAFDCAAITPQQAMQCCESMKCAPHGHHGMDCCKTMPSARAVLGQPCAVATASPTMAAIGGPLATFVPASGLNHEAGVFSANCHAPPSTGHAASVPLRI